MFYEFQNVLIESSLYTVVYNLTTEVVYHVKQLENIASIFGCNDFERVFFSAGVGPRVTNAKVADYCWLKPISTVKEYALVGTG